MSKNCLESLLLTCSICKNNYSYEQLITFHIKDCLTKDNNNTILGVKNANINEFDQIEKEFNILYDKNLKNK